MKIGDRFDLSNIEAKNFIQKIIDSYGISKDINQIATSVNCQTENGQKFAIVQFHATRYIAHILKD